MTTAWTESLTRLLSIYELDPSGAGTPVASRVQEDWAVFDLAEDQVLAFLQSAVGDHELLAEGALVRVRPVGEAEEADHAASWAAFSEEIRTSNRYFPVSALDLKTLSTGLAECVKEISEGTKLYRARIADDGIPSGQKMGAPPREKATAGRANPVGIPYLYLAFEVETCIYETRPARHARLAIGSFVVRRPLRVVNLAEIEAPDFFSAEGHAAYSSTIHLYRYLRALGEDLRKPVRTSDQTTDYIPTQYLCELAKSKGFDGVLYSSSVAADGHNLVLFSEDAAECVRDPDVYEITELSVVWSAVPNPSE